METGTVDHRPFVTWRKSYTAQDGSTRWVTEIVADNVRFLDWPRDVQTGDDGEPQEQDDGGDLPF